MKAGTVEKTRNSDEAHNPRIASRPVVVNFPRRPAPEVNIEITKLLLAITELFYEVSFLLHFFNFFYVLKF